MEQELESAQKFYHLIIEFFVNYSFQVVGALIIIFLGWIVSRWAYKAIVRQFQKHSLDVTLGQFTGNFVEAFGDSSINIGIRYWAPTKKYFQTQYQINLAIYQAIRSAGITIPYPQRDVRMIAAGQ
ncbi:MAG: mechanosensitive ion channel [Campylobacterota bacterium]|nr:mechanosensitive ion channel [Campylobacterota bacterium]